MEQPKITRVFIKKLASQFMTIFCLFIFIAGCKKAIPNPETLDPIYKDLVSELKTAEKLLKDEQTNLERLYVEKKNIEPRSLERKINLKEIKKAANKVSELKQTIKYLEIRSERRRVEARKDYKIHFKKDLSWPDPNEYKMYLVNKRLRSAPLNWNYRVPKLHARNPNFKDLSKLEVKSKKGGGEE